jgi:hypothetical protein
MPDTSTNLCSKCNKPMSLALPPGGNGPRSMRCIECDGPDPLTRPDVVNLVNTLGRKE